jgi:hypothetical protein
MAVYHARLPCQRCLRGSAYSYFPNPQHHLAGLRTHHSPLCYLITVHQQLVFVACACACRTALGRSLCGCVCWGTALLVSLWGLPGPDAPIDSDFVYKDAVNAIINSTQVGAETCTCLTYVSEYFVSVAAVKIIVSACKCCRACTGSLVQDRVQTGIVVIYMPGKRLQSFAAA